MERRVRLLCADSGYGSEMNYEYMVSEQITPFVKYNIVPRRDEAQRGRTIPFLIEKHVL